MKIDGYKYGPKNNWRRWQWNRISERITIPTIDAIVLYLAGKDDLDRAIAVEHGFSPSNLIAIDREEEVVKHLRGKGALCLKGDFLTVVRACWFSKMRPNVLIADFCGGLSEDISMVTTMSLFDVYQGLLADDAVISINMMRGRDKGFLMDNYKKVKNRHRGVIIVEHFVETLYHSLLEVCCNMPNGMRNLVTKESCLKLIKANMFPEMNSYRGERGNFYMDSVIFKPFAFIQKGVKSDDGCGYEHLDPRVRKGGYYDKEKIETFRQELGDVVGQINAIMAVRTMRLNGTLSASPRS